MTVLYTIILAVALFGLWFGFYNVALEIDEYKQMKRRRQIEEEMAEVLRNNR